jgi:hypothetical protein
MRFQLAKVRPRSAWYEQKVPHPFLRAVSFVPTFSDGTLPAALLSFMNARDRKVFGTVKINQMEVGYLVRETQVAELTEFLFEQKALKALANKSIICFVIEEGKECFFYNVKSGRDLLETTLPASLKAFRMNRRPVRPTLMNLLDILCAEPQTKLYPAYPD